MAIPLHGSAAAAALAVLVSLLAAATVAQPTPPSCAASLVPCQPYLASAKPPESCCGPLKQTVKDQLPCLCTLYSSKDLLKEFGVNLTQALELPLHCGISNDLSKCSGVSGNSTKAPAPPAGNNSNTALEAGSVVMFGLTSLLLFLWSMA